MSDLIDRDALLARLKKDCEICKSKGMDREYGSCGFCGMTGAIGEVKRAPTVDAEPMRHGRWKTVTRHEHYPSGKRYEADYCSECSKRGSREYDFCPNCGAKMTGVHS